MSRKGVNIKTLNTSKNNLDNNIKGQKEENSLEINSYSISEEKINDNINIPKLIKNNESIKYDKKGIGEKGSTLKAKKTLNKNKDNSSSNRTIKFRNQQKISIDYTETNAVTNAGLLQRPEKILKKKKRVSITNTIQEGQDLLEIPETPQLTTRQKLSRFFESNNRLFYIRIIVITLTTLSYIYYVVCTYKPKLFKSLNYIDFVVCSLLIIEHIINILISHYFWKFLYSIESMVNFVIEIPPFFSLLCDDDIGSNWYRFINFTRVLRLIKCYIIMDIYQNGEKSVKSQILNIILSILLIIFIFAGEVQIYDYDNVIEQLKLSYDEESRYYLNHRKYYHHYIYFIIVSLTTVGYGDIMPISVLSKFTMIFFVIFILAVIPNQTDELINLSNAQTIYERKEYISNPDIPFVVLLGNIELDILKSFCEEYFHSDHGQFYRHLVILMNEYPRKAFEYFLLENDNTKFIYYLQGDPMKSENLLRADILKAKACIIFCDKNAFDLSSEDQQEIFLALYIKKFYYVTTLENKINETKKDIINSVSQLNPKNLLKGNNFKIILQLNKTESPTYYYGALQNNYKKYLAKDQLLIIENLKMNLLSKSCVTPGIISLLYNLIISASTDKNSTNNAPEWIREYTEGTEYEIYKFTAEGELLNYSYPQLAVDIYNKFHSLLIALEINYKGNSLIKLNPQSTETISDIIEKNINNIDKKLKEDNSSNNTISSDSFAEEEESRTEKTKKLVLKRNYIKINFYLISKDKEVIEELQKMDKTKVGMSALKSRYRKSVTKKNTLRSFDEQKLGQSSTYRNLKSDFNNIKSNRNLKRSKTRKTSGEEEISESDESSSSDDEIDTKEIISEILDNIDKYEEKEKIINNYYTVESLGKTNINNDIKFPTIKDRRDIKDHVIICGTHSEIVHFILPLRAKYLTKNMIKWIVILAPNLPEDIQNILSIFPKIIYIEGDPLYPENLHKCNIATAEIAVILNNNYSNNKTNLNQNENEEIKIEDQFLDSSTLFIYNSIRKINRSIKIITELLYTNNIEFLLSSKFLKKLQEDKINSSKNNDSLKSGSNRMNYKMYPNYELTPVFATGEIYLPSLGDKILAQMFYNSNLLTIINLILEGDKNIMKKKEKKLNDVFQLTGSNLFMIPCEIKNESFGEMFERMITKNGILCIALYRKNLIDNFYYVYTNPKKTTLIKDTDYIFILAGTGSIEEYYKQNKLKINKNIDKENQINNKDEKNEKEKPAFFNGLKESMKKQYIQMRKSSIISLLDNQKNLFNSFDEKSINLDSMNLNNIGEENKLNDINIFIEENLKENKDLKPSNDEISQKKYKEIEELQEQVNKTMEKLKQLNNSFNEFENNINGFVKDEVKNDLLIYLNKVK